MTSNNPFRDEFDLYFRKLQIHISILDINLQEILTGISNKKLFREIKSIPDDFYIDGGPGWYEWSENCQDDPAADDHKGEAIAGK